MNTIIISYWFSGGGGDSKAIFLFIAYFLLSTIEKRERIFS